MTREEFARSQRERLQAAMAEAVGAHGYASTTVQELVAMAGVSNSTFYANFRNKQECYFATSQGVIERIGAEIAEAYREPADFRGRLTAALRTFMQVAAERPAEVSLVIVDSLTLGAAGARHREQASEAAVAMVERGLAEGTLSREATTLMARALVSGVRGVAYWRLRAGREKELPDTVEELVDWVLCYQQPPGDLASKVAAVAAEPLPPLPPPDQPALSWEEPPDSPRSRHALTQRERLVRATARIAFERGYQALSIPAISTAAGVSNETFYAHFSSKDEAFLDSFEALSGELLNATLSAMSTAESQPEALGRGIRAMLEYLASNAPFSKIVFYELSMAGPQALDRGDSILDAFTAFLEPEALGQGSHSLPGAVREAIGTAVWGLLQFEVYRGDQAELPKLGPEIARIACIPIDCRLGAG